MGTNTGIDYCNENNNKLDQMNILEMNEKFEIKIVSYIIKNSGLLIVREHNRMHILSRVFSKINGNSAS